MKQKIIITSLLMLNFSFAQVGIGTTSPQKELHIAGENSTIRIDGLNSDNNASNLGEAGKTYPLHVNTDGDFVISNTSSTGAVMLTNEEDNIITGINVFSNNPTNDGKEVTKELYTKSFTITRTALVFISYTTSFSISNFTGDAVDDGKAKLIQNFFYLEPKGQTDLTELGKSGGTYTNGAKEGSNATGIIYNTGHYITTLNPGTYTLRMQGRIWAGPSNPTATIDQLFRVNFGSDNDTLAIYYL